MLIPMIYWLDNRGLDPESLVQSPLYNACGNTLFDLALGLTAQDVWVTLAADAIEQHRLSKAPPSFQRSLDALIELLSKETDQRATQQPVDSPTTASAVHEAQMIINSPTLMNDAITNLFNDVNPSPQPADISRSAMASVPNTLFEEAHLYTARLPYFDTKRLALSDTGLICLVPPTPSTTGVTSSASSQLNAHEPTAQKNGGKFACQNTVLFHS